ncbi:MAG: T9SS type A sorting domain-containing protein [Ignavibacteria bacterium]|nr:T9SS type A sorting domain-containing protein [Ignavibacteria bacterium]
MKKSVLLAILALIVFSVNVFSQYSNVQEKYSQVRINFTSDFDIQRMAAAGLFLDHGSRKGNYFETWLSESEIAMLKNSGVPFQILIDDWMSYYNTAMRKGVYVNNNVSLTDAYDITHSIYGTMGGHLKWEEAIAKLDSMRLQYPNLISVKFSYGNSYENRPLWTVRVTKNPDAPTGRPEIWLNGVTHAREPMGMMNVFYYLYWLFENYNIDPVATYILNNREIYFTPFINPDGYYYNQTTNPGGGGMWRKNRQPYGGSIGTDCNRNFGTYNFWNSTNGGSSATPSSDTYRGPYPFSSKEDSLWKVFVNSRNFKTSLDYHTHGNLLIKPYAWCDPTPTPDDAIFNEMGAECTVQNHYLFGTPYQTVNYYVRGGDLDWMYSTDSTGHSSHIYTMTPEIGNTGVFWAAYNDIIPFAKDCMIMNIYMSLIAGPYASLKSATFNKQVYTQNETGNVKVVFRNKGLAAASNVKVQLTPLSSYVTIPVQLYTKATMPSRTSDSTTFNFTVSGSTPNNYGIPARLKIMQNDTITLYNKVHYILVGNGTALLLDSAENGFTNWTTSNTWGVVTTQYHTPTHSFTDSPTGNYLANANNSMTLNFPLNTQSSPVVFLSFWHRYYTEAGYDYCRVEVSSNNGTNWSEVTNYNGNMQTWTAQSFDISEFCNGSQNVRIRFRLTSDQSLQYDGWYIDDIKISAYSSLTGIEKGGETPVKYALEQNYPNPFNPSTTINFSIPKQGFVNLTVYDMLGREVKTLVNSNMTQGNYAVVFESSNLASGIYYYRIKVNGFIDIKKMILVK